MSKFEELQQELQQNLLMARVSQEWLRFLKRPQAAHIRPNEANFEMFKAAFTDLNQFDADACVLLLDDHAFVAGLALVTPQQTNEELIAEIIGLLKKARTPDQLRLYEKQLRTDLASGTKSTEWLKQRRDELVRTKALEHNFTSRELKAIGKPSPAGPPELPVKYTKEVLLQLASTGPGRAEFRKLMAYYGADSLTARLNDNG